MRGIQIQIVALSNTSNMKIDEGHCSYVQVIVKDRGMSSIKKYPTDNSPYCSLKPLLNEKHHLSINIHGLDTSHIRLLIHTMHFTANQDHG